MRCVAFSRSISAGILTLKPSQYQVAIQWQWGVATVDDYDWFVEDNTGAVWPRTCPPLIPPTLSFLFLSTMALRVNGHSFLPVSRSLKPEPLRSNQSRMEAAVYVRPRLTVHRRVTKTIRPPGQAENSGEPSLDVDFNPSSIGRRDPCTAGCGTLDTGVDTTDITASWSAMARLC